MYSRWMQVMTAVLVLSGLLLGALWPVGAKQPIQLAQAMQPSREFEPGQLLVKFQTGVSAASAQSVLRQYSPGQVETLYGSEVQLWQVPIGEEPQIAEQLNLDPRVEYAELNYRVYALDTAPNDPDFGKQWAHSVMRSPAAWDLTTGAATVTIAILDTGIDEGHPDLAARIVAGYDLVDLDADPHDLNGHGTHVAGIASAVTNNGLGVAGMDWQARIMPIRVLGENGDGTVDDLAEGISWAVDQGARLLNLSLGTDGDDQTLRDAIAAAHNHGALVVAAMGNGNTDVPVYPAAYEEVLAVAATGPNDARAPYSNFGDHCDLAAPGGTDLAGIYSTMPTYQVWMTRKEGHSPWYDYVSGTSQATAYVAGLAALIWAQDPSLSAAQVQTTIKATAKDLGPPGPDSSYGYGRIEPLMALRAHSAPFAPVLAPISNAAGAGAYLIDWSDVPFAATYTLQEADNPLFLAPIRYDDLLSSQFQVTGRIGGTWYYRVRARNGYGDSPWSGTQMTVVRPAAPVLSPIPNPGDQDQYQLTWSAAVGATAYRLEESSDGSFVDPTTRYRGDALHYNVTGQPGGTWYYRVVAYNRAGDSPPSNVQTTLVSPPALLAPDLHPIDNEDGDSEYLVSWSSVSQASTYTLEQSADAYFITPVVVLTGPEQQASISGRPRGRWYYRVRAGGPAGNSPWSQARSVVVPFWVYLPELARNHAQPGLLNGGFEYGSAGWVEYSVKGLPLVLAAHSLAPVIPHSGTWAARLGREHDAVSYIEQKVTVPTDQPFLHYWHWIVSDDECGFDVASIRVNGILSRLYYLCRSTSTGQWVETVVNLGGYTGQTVTLQLRVEADLALESNLYLDDFSFEASASVGGKGSPQAARPGPGW